MLANRVILVLATSAAVGGPVEAERRPAKTAANVHVELVFTSTHDYPDPFNAIDLDAVFTGPAGRPLRVPGFWAGGRTWKVRFASPQLGVHRYVTQCTDPSSSGLHRITGRVEVVPYRGENPLLQHGPIRVAGSRRTFEHDDGTPFFWLGDTWWMGLSRRLHWPDEFARLAADRAKKGFSVVQIVAGLYPDMGPFDERGLGDAGFPWEKDYRRIRPEYFDAADQRLFHLVDSRLVPCLVGAWGYHLPWLGSERMKKHWRYLVGRYAALPIVWCVAGEVNLPYYAEPGFPFESRAQVRDWTPLAEHVRRIDPFARLLTVHPTGLGQLSARAAIDDVRLIDFDMLQTGHGDLDSLAPSVSTLRRSYAAEPTMPVINSEVCYEGIGNRCRDDVQRLMFWASMLSGAAGHTYGANGIWQVNRDGQPYGRSASGADYGDVPWNVAMDLPGSTQVGLGRRLLEQFDWYQFEPHPEWAIWDLPPIKPRRNPFLVPYSAGIPGRVRIIYLPVAEPVKVQELEPDTRYVASYFDPKAGQRTDLGAVRSDSARSWKPPTSPQPQPDAVLILEAKSVACGD